MRVLEASEVWERVEKDGHGGCWRWRGAIGSNGYGHLQRRGVTISAHRWAYQEAKGEIPEGMCVCHTCDNKWCVNPDHLWPGTMKDNHRDREAKGRGRRLHGNAHPNAALTADDIENIRANSMNLSQRELGRLFGCSQGHISDIVTRKRWRHI
jgi:hypothetical protein